MKVILDENNYFTGNYCTIGDLPNSVEVEGLPNEADRYKSLSYQLIDGKWVFNEHRYQEIIAEKENEDQKRQKQQLIDDLKQELSDADYKIIKCSEARLIGEELPYDVYLLHTERDAVRDKINELKAELKTFEDLEVQG